MENKFFERWAKLGEEYKDMKKEIKINIPYHTPIGECTSNCRREGCPEEATEEEQKEIQAMIAEEQDRRSQELNYK